MTDRIILTGIEIYAHGGVTAAEREIGQRYRVDVTLELDLTEAIASDAIDATTHYGKVHGAIVETVRGRPFNLLESVAGRVADRLLEEFGPERVTVRLAKLLPPIDGVVASAAVELTRERRDPGPSS